jgi:hypothetical protein
LIYPPGRGFSSVPGEKESAREWLAGAAAAVYRGERRSERAMDADEGGGGATLTVGPASGGMVRVLVEGGGPEILMHFAPEGAEKIADELGGAADRARGASRRGPAAGPSPASRDGRARR